MDTKSTGVGLTCLTLLAFVLGIAVYPTLPPLMAFHWGTLGEVGGLIPTFWGVFLYPFFMCLMFVVWLGIPQIEPMQKNIQAFRTTYNGFWIVQTVFLFYLFMLTVGNNSGWLFNFNQALSPAIALLFAAAAVLLEHSRRNYFIGIRTPWTLSSDKIWKRTHLLGSKLFYFCAVWAFAGVVYPEYLLLYLSLPIFITVVITVSYSYIEFKRSQV